MKNKGLDCVELQHRGGIALRDKLKGMTPEQVDAFWKERNRAFLKLFKANRHKPSSKTPVFRRASRQPV
jgi:hypothetical protein